MNDDERHVIYLRELQLIDRILGLEAEVARLSVDSGINDIRILKKSRAWKLGNFILTPFAVVYRGLRPSK